MYKSQQSNGAPNRATHATHKRRNDANESFAEFYYLLIYGRRNRFREGLLSTFLDISSFPKMILENFIRTRMGERYFSFSGSLVLALVLAFVPPMISHSLGIPFSGFFGHFLTWYAFLAAFVVFTFFRYKEVRRKPGIFNTTRLSKSSGEILPFFLNLDIRGWRPTVRQVEIWVEPLACGLVGLLLLLCGQILGVLIIICAIIYGLSYAAQYMIGDHFILDIIDKMLFSSQMNTDFVEGRVTPGGAGFRGERPRSKHFRRSLYEDQDMDAADINAA